MLIDTIKLLPRKIYVKLEQDFRKELFDKCIAKTGTVTNLASKVGVARQELNKWRWGWQRTPFKVFNLLLNYANFSIDDVWRKIDGFGLQGQKTSFKLPRFIEITEDLVWFIGVRHGDRCENYVQIGINNSDIDILKNFCKVLFSFGFQPEKLYFYVYGKDIKNGEKKKQIKKTLIVLCKAKEENIKFYIRYTSNLGIMLQVNNSLFHKLIYRIEDELKEILESFPYFKSAYVRGFADAEGCVDHHGHVVITQKFHERGKKNIELVRNLMKSFGIKSHVRVEKNKLRLIVEKQCLKSYENFVGFCSMRKMSDLRMIREAYEIKYDNRKIEDEIVRLANEPITRRQIILKLKSKYTKTGIVIRKLEKEGKIKIINKRPLTIISLKEGLHD